ncbi:hypothetical protein [Novosphingobium sp.]|uniref:hypothetical protein n=1 Tax=Novosphingobium sp. TaxID=1874826 RepID=UPI00333F3D73
MRRLMSAVLVLGALVLPTAAFAGHSDLTVPPADTFLLGGDQGAAMAVSGRNVGQTVVVIQSRVGSVDTVIAQVAPGGTFAHDFAVGEVALIANVSTTQAARLSVDFTGSPASLSMRYALPQKN